MIRTDSSRGFNNYIWTQQWSTLIYKEIITDLKGEINSYITMIGSSSISGIEQ
jgi:hypothetical protein